MTELSDEVLYGGVTGGSHDESEGGLIQESDEEVLKSDE